MCDVKQSFMIFFSVLLIASSLEAKRIFLLAGKNQISVIDTEDESKYCIIGIPFDEDILFALTFATHPMTTCYIGQQEWLRMYERPSDIRDHWINSGLDPAGRKVIAVRIFRRHEFFPSFYELMHL